MSRLVLVLSVFAVMVIGPGASAQVTPNFAGKWTLIPEKASPPTGPRRGATDTVGSGWGQEITITLEAGTLIIERAQFSPYDSQPPMRFGYALDGSDSRNVINMGRGPQEQISRAAWKGTMLVITTRHGPARQPAAPPPTEVTHVFSLDESGALVIQTTRGSGEAAATTTTRYKRG